MLEILAAGALRKRDGSHWRVVSEPPAADPMGLQQELLGRYPHVKLELTLLGRCGEQLDGVLTGKQDPLSLLFPREGVRAEDFYRDSRGATVLNRLVQLSIREALAALLPGRHLRVLEIGAGTGGTTGSVLPVLPAGQTEYHFTDLSAAFFDAAANRFSQYPFLKYRVLDIERDPSSQGFGRHEYDLILAANVLHATRNIRQTMVHVRQLLAPGGLLVLSEGLERQAWLDLTFGMLDGWWRFEDDLRPDHALLNLNQWSSLLQSQGFTEPAALTPEGLTQHAVILSRGPSSLDLPLQQAGSWLIVADSQGLGAGLAEGLGRHGQSCVLAVPADHYAALGSDHYLVPIHDQEGWGRLLAEAVPTMPPLRGVVHLLGLDAAPTDATTTQTLTCDTYTLCRSTLTLVQALLRNDRRPSAGLWLVTAGAQVAGPERGTSLAQSPLWGLGKVIALEHPELACRLIDLDALAPQQQWEPLIAELLAPGAENQVALRGKRRLVPRLVRSHQASDRLALPDEGDFRLEKGADGTLEGLHLSSGSLSPPAAGEVQIEVRAAGLNFRDLMDALGQLNALGFDVGPLGSEMSGRVVAVGTGVEEFVVGDEVVGLAAGALARRVSTLTGLLARKPEWLSHIAMATVPVAFTTASLAFQLAALKAGDRVLIHAASGGVGLAALQVARSKGAKVFATASAPKHAYLRSLGIELVYNSRSTDFARQILADTGGVGVDVVLNSLTGAGFVEATLSTLSRNGRFVEIGKRDIWPAERVVRARPDVVYHVLALDVLITREPERIGALFREVMDALESNQLQPLPKSVFRFSEAPAAFRHMQRTQHIGKIVLTVPPPPLVPRLEGTYLITGGLGALGLRAAEWLVQQGAKHLVLNGRHPADGEAEAAVGRIRRSGAEVRVMLGDVSREEDIRLILHQIDDTMPRLTGVIHAAGVLRDAALVNQSWERFEAVLAPKVLGAWHLHRLTEGRDLRLFVLFSSTTSVLGNRGQANHAAANAFLDQLAWERRARGLAGLSINWGAWSEVGAAAQIRGGLENLASRGIQSLTPDQGIEVLGQLLSRDLTEVAVANIGWSEFFKAWPAAASSPLLSALVSESTHGPVRVECARRDGTAFLDTLRSAAPEHHARLVEAYLRDNAAKVLGLAGSELDSHQPLVNLGLDSLMALELKNRIEDDFGVRLPMGEFLEGSSIARLVELLLNKMARSSVLSPALEPEGKRGTETEWEVLTL
jgi:NADPH:quinone reductase-like Zn-dependent oxidoreductase/SAM-dependent methyltransferase/acyl carrier protein